MTKPQLGTKFIFNWGIYCGIIWPKSTLRFTSVTAKERHNTTQASIFRNWTALTLITAVARLRIFTARIYSEHRVELCSCALLASVLNILAIVALWRTSQLHAPSNLLHCHLALTDHGVGCFVQPVLVARKITCGFTASLHSVARRSLRHKSRSL